MFTHAFSAAVRTHMNEQAHTDACRNLGMRNRTSNRSETRNSRVFTHRSDHIRIILLKLIELADVAKESFKFLRAAKSFQQARRKLDKNPLKTQFVGTTTFSFSKKKLLSIQQKFSVHSHKNSIVPSISFASVCSKFCVYSTIDFMSTC